jgi:hypothetical protein
MIRPRHGHPDMLLCSLPKIGRHVLLEESDVWAWIKGARHTCRALLSRVARTLTAGRVVTDALGGRWRTSPKLGAVAAMSLQAPTGLPPDRDN